MTIDIVDDAILLPWNVWDTDCHLYRTRVNTVAMPTVPLYMQSIQIGGVMVAEIMW